MSEKIPEKWTLTELSKIVIYSKGKKPKKLVNGKTDGYVPYVNIKAFEQKIIDEYADVESSKLVDESDILVVWDGARFGLSGTAMVGAAGSTLMVLKPILCYSRFVHAFINRYYQFINSKPKGSGTPHVNPDIFWNLPFPLPPLNEQKRIVAKLDAIIPRIDSVKERLEKIPVILKRFRQSVLTAAVTGKLTEKWREENTGVDSEKKQQNFAHLKTTLNLPKHWKLIKAKNCCEHITKGTTPKNKGFTTKGIPFLKVYNIVDNEIDFEYKQQFVSKEAHSTVLKRSMVFPGTVVMNIVGPPLGKVAIIPDDYPEWNLNQAIAIFRPLKELYNKYLYFVLLEGFCLHKILIETRGVVGQSNLSLDQCQKLEIPLPPLEEQKEIVRQVDKLFALADKVEAHYQQAKERVDKLSQSVLAKAFRGELVNQDPTDEPAEKLLEQILEEKAKMEATLKKAKKKSTTKKTKKKGKQ